MKLLRAAAATFVVASASLIVFAPAAEAHETRRVGPYQFVVGWLNEPSFAGVTNAVSLVVTDTRSTPPTPVTELDKTFRVEVFQGGLTTPFASTFRGRFGVPGAYAADIVPTRAGSYRFVINGSIGELRVNETFESGPGRFDEVRPQTALQYPEQVPAGAELAGALRDVRSLSEQVRLLAIIALVLAAAAVILPMVRSRRA